MKILNSIKMHFGIFLLFVTVTITPFTLFANRTHSLYFKQENMWQFIETTLLTEENYEEGYQFFLDIIMTFTDFREDRFDMLVIFHNLPNAKQVELMKYLFPRDVLNELIEFMVSDVYEWGNGETKKFEIAVSTFRQYGRIELNREEILTLLLEGLPQCTPKQVKTLQTRSALETVMPPCNPIGTDYEDYFNRNMDNIDIPETVELSTFRIYFDLGRELGLSKEEVLTAQTNIQRINKIVPVLLWGVLSLYLVGIATTTRKLSDFFYASSLPLIISGAITGIGGTVLFLFGKFTNFLTGFIFYTADPDTPEFLLFIFFTIKNAINQHASLYLLNIGLLFLLFGTLILFIGKWIVNHKSSAINPIT